MFRWAHALVLAALCVAIAEGATDVPESCQSLAERYASAPDQTTLAALQACLAAERPDALQVTALPTALAARTARSPEPPPSLGSPASSSTPS